MSLLLIAEHSQGLLTPATLSTITAAQLFSVPIHVVMMGDSCQKAAEMASTYTGIEKVWTVESPLLAHSLPEQMTDTLIALSKNYKFILSPSTTFGKNLLPRLAALLDVTQLSDVMAIKDEKTFIRPTYAGNALATVTSEDPIKIMTIRPTAFKKATIGDSKASIKVYPFKAPSCPVPIFVKMEENKTKRPDLASASVVVSGGRGLQTKENFLLLEILADKLGAAVGASRAAVDAGFVPNDYQIGQTGKTVSPDLYIAIGISGAIQHLAGMRESKVIVAINKDPDAPIFHLADYGLVGDLFTILPELTSKIKDLRKMP